MLDIARRLAGPNFKRILTAEEEYAATTAWRDHRCERSRLLIMQCHVKFVVKEVMRQRSYKANAEDMLSEGMLGMTIALDKFDPDAGFRFITYARHWISAMHCAHLLLTEGRSRVPNSTKAKKIFFGYRQASAAIRKRITRSGAHVTEHEIESLTAEAIGVDVEDLRLVIDAMRDNSSLDAPAQAGDDENNRSVVETIADDALTPEEALLERQAEAFVRENVAQALSGLTDREKSIIESRQLVDEDQKKTLEDLSQIYDVSRERIRQIEAKALLKLTSSLQPSARLLEYA